jgi:hypothetical protein
MTLKEYLAKLELDEVFAKRSAEAKSVLTEQLRRQRAPTELDTVQMFTGLVVTKAADLKQRVARARTDDPGTWEERELAAVRSHGHGETDAFEKVAMAILRWNICSRGDRYSIDYAAHIDWLIANYKANKATYGAFGDGWRRSWLERRDQDGNWDKIFDRVQDLSGDMPLALLVPVPRQPRPPAQLQPWGSWATQFLGPAFHEEMIAQHRAHKRQKTLDGRQLFRLAPPK